jgi:hypothetical protein
MSRGQVVNWGSAGRRGSYGSDGSEERMKRKCRTGVEFCGN